MPAGRPPLYTDPEDMQVIIDDYFNTDAWVDCGEAGIQFRPTMSGLAIALGMDRASLVNYSHKEKFFDTVKRARARVEQALENNLYNNNVTGTIFNLKNNFGWKDKQEIGHTSPDGSMTPNITFNGVGKE